ncbi:hypothetical protein OAS67_06770 [Alphaproteobacteria bacterium]|nr:hypothetical protein [Alphaproteobacteria bacterium]
MDQRLERETVIELLGRLGDENDDTVLATARSLHAVIQGANVNWNDLLVPDGSVDSGSYEDEEAEDGNVVSASEDEDEDEDEEIEDGNVVSASYEDEEVEDDEFVQSPVTDSSESMALINKMLNASNVSDALREELQGYKEDISENEFTTSDAAYLKVLAERLKS